MAIAILVLRFAVELFGVAAFSYWGFQTPDAGLGRLALGIGAPLALVVVWGVVVAPKARNPLPQRQRDLIGTVLLLVAAAGLAVAGQPAVAAVFAAVVVLNQLLLIAFDADPATALRWTAGRGR